MPSWLLVPMPRERPGPATAASAQDGQLVSDPMDESGSDSARLVDIPTERIATVQEDKGSSEQVRIAAEVGLIYGGLIIVGVYMVAPFLTAASLDLSAKVCVVAFSVAIPLLAALLLVNRRDVFRRRITRSVLIEITRAVAWSCAFAGVVAGFWHILWIAGVGILVSAFVGVAVQLAGYWGLRRDQAPTPQEGEEPSDTGS